MLNKHSLITRLLIIVSGSAMVFALIYAKLHYSNVFDTEMQRSNNTILQIGQTVSATASIAAYLEDKDLANEVLNGLVSNDVILAAQLNGQQSVLAKSILYKTELPITFVLSNPFIIGEQIGAIYIEPNTIFIEQSAQTLALSSVQTLLVVILPMLVIFAILVYALITQPLNYLSCQLAKISPGKGQRIVIPATHRHSEIGTISGDINKLLSRTETLFLQERSLRKDIERFEKRFRLMFEKSSSPTLLVKDKGDILLINEAAQDLLAGLGIDLEERFPHALGKACKTPDILYTFTSNSINQKQVMQSEFEFNNQLTLETVWLNIIIINTESDNQSYLQVFINDITMKKVMITQLKQKAQFDTLTGLSNRYGAELILLEWLDQQRPFSLMLLDLDEFKPINDIHGHNAGDSMLQHVAQQLQLNVRTDDLICRWGGDEFLIALANITEQETKDLATTLSKVITTPMQYYKSGQEHTLIVSASLGIARYPDHANTLKTLVECADIAMYTIKRTSKNSFAFYQI
ncbi:sensor domain-containing diguanylate cyclase [Pseudoalteromonas aurantia]|nr:diguanylate cyclase [Pseudoalteromonas aurantia]